MDYSMDHGGSGSERLAAASDAEGALGLAQLMDELAHGVLVVSLQGRLLHANQAARHALARRSVLLAEQRELRCACPEQGRRLQDALGRIAQGKRSLLTLGGPQGDSLTLAVIPLREGAGRPDRAALVFSRASVCESLMLGFFARSHGLTHTEELVLGILCHGFSAPEIAAQMKVAVSTVRSHVRSLCAKTRSSGVRELVNRVAVLPPVAPSLHHQPMH
jgi:DNA-binding CsgD family transcriptional regulator